MALLADVKVRLRIAAANTTFDTDIANLILEAKKDLTRRGVLTAGVIDTDVAITSAIVSYCRAYFDLSNPDIEKWIKVYESQRDSLSLDGDYNGLAV